MTPAAICQALLMVRGEVDPFASFVKSLLHLNTDLADSATPANTWTFDGGAAITAVPANVLAGAGSLSCESSTDDRITDNGTIFDLGTGDFCIECWFKDNNIGGKNQGLFLIQSVSTTQSVRVFGSAASTITADATGGGPAGPEVSYSLSTWNHIAVTRSGSNWTLWLNGTAEKTWTNGTFNGGSGSSNIWLGSLSSAGTSRQCIIDEFRLTIGTPRYTGAFSPSFPFPNP